jgi:predicted transposase/invertase (TIGR01784 family)
MPHRYIDITTDFGFKRMFGREESKAILKGFLVAMLDLPHPIVELSFIPNEQLPATPAERHGIYDLYCQDQVGNRFIVEMQRSTMKYYKERTLYYASFPIIQQVEKGKAYDFQLMPIYCLNILRYKMDEDSDYYHHVQLVNTRTGKVFYEKLTFVYVELPKFTLALEDLTTTQEKWMYLLKHIYDMPNVPDMFQDEPFSYAFRVAEYSALSEEEQLLYRQNLKTLSDA